jgi:hypothetical protein
MSFFFSPAIKEALRLDPQALHNVDINVLLFRTAPSMSSDASSLWRNANTKAELLTYLGWEEVSGISGYPLTTKLRLNQRPNPAWVSGDPSIFLNNYYYTFDEYLFSGLGQAISIAAIGFERASDGMLIFASNSPTGTLMNITPGDKLMALEDPAFLDDTNRYLLWFTKNPVAVDPQEGPIVLLKAAPVFEISNTLHAWLYPQRANMIANPSFETSEGDPYWSPTVERVADPAPGGGAWAGKFTGDGVFAVESNVWPTVYGSDQSELWTLQLMVKAGADTTQLRVGLVYWDADYRGTNVDWGTEDEQWELRSEAWTHIACVRHAPQAHQAMLRLDVGGTEITIDRVLAERGALKEYPYFDGDEMYADAGAYSWYGGESVAGRTYSMWYSGRRAVIGRLFATPKDTDAPEDYITDTDVLAAGLVYKWVPAGVTVIPHMDVFYPNDLRWWPPPRTKPVLPYSTTGDDGMGVDPPPDWPPANTPQIWSDSSVASVGVAVTSSGFIQHWPGGSTASVGVAAVSGTMLQPASVPAGAVHHFDFSNASSLNLTGTTINSITDRVGTLVLNNAAGTVTTNIVGNAGLTAGRNNAYGGPFNRLTNNGCQLNNQPMWVSLVGRITPKPGGTEGYKANFFQLNSSATPTGRTGSLVIGDSDNHVYLQAGSSIESTFNADDQDHTYFWEFNGASSKLYVDGVLAVSGNAGTNGTTLGGQLTLFNVHNGSSESDTAIGEIVLGTGTHTLAEIQTEDLRLRTKWNLSYTFADGAFHDVIVPVGVTSAVFECWGAGPGPNAPLTLNGNGAYIRAVATDLVPGETLRLTPGGVGNYAGAGGFNGGGACTGLGGSDGNGGNGASDIRRGGTALADRKLVGGAGGGGINASGGGSGGPGGYPTGGVGTAFSGNGTGGTQTAGGVSVAGPPNGTFGVGATSPSGPGGGRGGGGGGGGWWGGGAGASGFGTSCSGGGGSSYCDPSLILISAEAIGTWAGPGKVKVTFVITPPSRIAAEYTLPQNTGGNDPFLTGPMVIGRTMYTVESTGPELWKFNLDAPGTVGGGSATLTKTAITGGSFFAGHVTTGVATNGYMWGLITGPYRIARIDPATATFSGTVAVVFSYHTLGTDSWVYNSDGGNLITRIDPTGPTIVATSPSLAGSAGFMCFDVVNNALWSLSWTGVANSTDRKLIRLDPLTLAIVGTPVNLPGAGGKQLIPSVDKTGTYIYAVDGGTGTIYRVTIATGAVTTYASVIPVFAANEGSPSVVIQDQLYTWHTYVANTSEDVLAQVNVNTMVATLISGYSDATFGASAGSYYDGVNLWLLGRNVASGNQSDALIKMS